MDLKKIIAEVPDFPKAGISFKDITPILQDVQAFNYVTTQLAEWGKSREVDVVVGPEARGFLFGVPVALALNKGFVPVRKPGKLPRESLSAHYELEYGNNTLQMHKDAIKPGDRVLIVDDLLATGGTIAATIDMIESLGGIVVGCAFVIELDGLPGRKRLAGYDIKNLVTYGMDE